MEIVIPFKTPTINHLYWHRGNMRIMKKDAKELRDMIFSIVPILDEELQDKRLSVTTEIYEDWYTKKGDVKKKDIVQVSKDYSLKPMIENAQTKAAKILKAKNVLFRANNNLFITSDCPSYFSYNIPGVNREELDVISPTSQYTYLLGNEA